MLGICKVSEREYINRAFGQVAARICGDRTNRALAEATGVNATSIGEMKYGRVPGFKLLKRFADGLNLTDAERRELLRAAGYLEPEYDAGHYLIDLLRRLADAYGAEWVVMPRTQPPPPDAPPEEMERQARELEEEIRRERAEHGLANPEPLMSPNADKTVTNSSGCLGGECSPPGETYRYESLRDAGFAFSR